MYYKHDKHRTNTNDAVLDGGMGSTPGLPTPLERCSYYSPVSRQRGSRRQAFSLKAAKQLHHIRIHHFLLCELIITQIRPD